MDRDIVVNARVFNKPLTGVQRYAFEIIRRLPGPVQLVAPRPVRPEYASLACITTVDLLGRLACNKIAGHLWEQMALPRLVSGRTLLWSPWMRGPLAVRNQVLTVHDLVRFEHPEWFPLHLLLWYRFLIPRLVHRVKRIITVSEFTRVRLVEVTGVSPEKIVVIPNGVDRRFSPRPPEEVSKVRDTLGIPSSDYALSVSSLEPRKNLGRLLKAWQIVHRTLPKDVWLVVAGTKGKSSVFRNVSVNKLPPRVHFTGYVPDEYLPALYSGAVAFVYISLYEGFGLPPLEAMACGTPVITSNVTSLPEVVGAAAILVDPYNVESIAQGTHQVIENETMREELRQKGLKQARQFTWERAADLTWRVLKEAAEG